MQVQHDQHCPACHGRGHVWVDPPSKGWKALETLSDGRRLWAVPGGGLHTFDRRMPELLMTLCDCVQPVTD